MFSRLCIVGISALALVACHGPKCLSEGQTGAVEQIGNVVSIGTTSSKLYDPDSNSIKIRLADGTKRVCTVPHFVADQLKSGDVIRGPITAENDWRYQ